MVGTVRNNKLEDVERASTSDFRRLQKSGPWLKRRREVNKNAASETFTLPL
jgi:hypothetical protein